MHLLFYLTPLTPSVAHLNILWIFVHKFIFALQGCGWNPGPGAALLALATELPYQRSCIKLKTWSFHCSRGSYFTFNFLLITALKLA